MRLPHHCVFSVVVRGPALIHATIRLTYNYCVAYNKLIGLVTMLHTKIISLIGLNLLYGMLAKQIRLQNRKDSLEKCLPTSL